MFLILFFPDLVLLLFLITMMAFLYASVGHGGASGYLAVLAIFSFAPLAMRSSALVLNVFVSLISFIQYYRIGKFKWKLFLSFALTSIPAAYIGASIPLNETLYKKTLGLLLLFAIFRLLMLAGEQHVETKEFKWIYGLLIGIFIGFLSGMIGIGGGILLSPVILLFRWATIKETAMVSALFIFVNSVAALFAIAPGNIFSEVEIYLWLAAAIIGGTLGAYWGSTKSNNNTLRYVLAVVLLIASLKLLIK